MAMVAAQALHCYLNFCSSTSAARCRTHIVTPPLPWLDMAASPCSLAPTWLVSGNLPAIRRDGHVQSGQQAFPVLAQEGLKVGRPNFLLALQYELHVERQRLGGLQETFNALEGLQEATWQGGA